MKRLKNITIKCIDGRIKYGVYINRRKKETYYTVIVNMINGVNNPIGKPFNNVIDANNYLLNKDGWTHKCWNSSEKDKRKDKYYKLNGWEIIRIKEIEHQNYKELLNSIKIIVKRRLHDGITRN